jgi:hypothetical protein
MSADTYFKRAAAELRKAVQEKRHDVDELKREISTREQKVRDYVNMLRRDKQHKESLAADGNTSDDDRAKLAREAQEDLGQVTSAEQALNKDKDIMRKTIDNLEREMNDIEHYAQQLEGRS